MIRDWLTGDFSELVANINQWFEDLTIIDPYGKALSNDFKLSAAMLRLISYREGEKTNDSFNRIKKELTPIESHIWRSIIQNRPLPDTVASKALKYINSKLMNSEDSFENLDRISCALLKAYILRIYRARGEKEPMKVELDHESTSVEYHAGRLLAILASIQQSALGDVNAGLVQRYYTAASSTPNLVIGRLIQMSQHHLNKLAKSEKGLAIWYEDLLASIMSQININDIPKVLSLEGQTLFALGYYQQKASRFKGKKLNEEVEGGEENDN
jgi:CRISPR-associated protein Csd1